MDKINIIKKILYVVVFIAIYQILLFLCSSAKFVYQHFIVKEANLIKKYGANSFVLITGGSSGQGKQFALNFAKRGFNIFLIGSKRSKNTIKEINRKYPNIKTVFIEKDFRQSFKKGFFDIIEEKIKKLDGNISILVNNVGHRTAWDPYHEMPEQLINDTIAVGTIVQSQLIRICIPHFLKRKHKSCILNITAQCIIPTYGLGEILSNQISIPYLSVYEASNAYGHYHANSIIKEYEKYNNKLDILNIMPGAVLTENTKFLKNTMFAINDDKFVNNIMKIVGNFYGNYYGYWGHELSILLMNLFPFLKNSVLHKVGHTIAHDYMNMPKKKY
jgi:short-subunit dehydrogenase